MLSLVGEGSLLFGTTWSDGVLVLKRIGKNVEDWRHAWRCGNVLKCTCALMMGIIICSRMAIGAEWWGLREGRVSSTDFHDTLDLLRRSQYDLLWKE